MLLEGQQEAPETVFPRPVKLSVSADQLRENMNYALSLGLPSIRPAARHDGVLAIAGGGPSLANTCSKLRHPGPNTRVAAANGSHDYLLSRGIVPHYCGLMDPATHLADLISPRAGVTYFVASTCDRAVFDKLNAYDVRLWHASGQLA
ncbi:MAG TPA: hypothetical protein VHN11_08460, partial [Xanthobacteraceae bacterium]|nr:hypothetical protein [Xanthobacteraceae bacterium]